MTKATTNGVERGQGPSYSRNPSSICSSVYCESIQAGRVRLRTEIEVPLPAERAWAIIADAQRFLTIDPFHERIVFRGPVLKQGVEMVLHHNVFGVRLRRVGRVLWVQEGRGYAFSDLSARGAHRGFPHVFVIELRSSTQESGPRTRLRIEVRGKWTMRWIPPALTRQWLLAVASEHARLLQRAFSQIES